MGDVDPVFTFWAKTVFITVSFLWILYTWLYLYVHQLTKCIAYKEE